MGIKMATRRALLLPQNLHAQAVRRGKKIIARILKDPYLMQLIVNLQFYLLQILRKLTMGVSCHCGVCQQDQQGQVKLLDQDLNQATRKVGGKVMMRTFSLPLNQKTEKLHRNLSSSLRILKDLKLMYQAVLLYLCRLQDFRKLKSRTLILPRNLNVQAVRKGDKMISRIIEDHYLMQLTVNVHFYLLQTLRKLIIGVLWIYVWRHQGQQGQVKFLDQDLNQATRKVGGKVITRTTFSLPLNLKEEILYRNSASNLRIIKNLYWLYQAVFLHLGRLQNFRKLTRRELQLIICCHKKHVKFLNQAPMVLTPTVQQKAVEILLSFSQMLSLNDNCLIYSFWGK